MISHAQYSVKRKDLPLYDFESSILVRYFLRDRVLLLYPYPLNISDMRKAAKIFNELDAMISCKSFQAYDPLAGPSVRRCACIAKKHCD